MSAVDVSEREDELEQGAGRPPPRRRAKPPRGGVRAVTKAKFTPVDAARAALAGPPARVTPSRARVLLSAATLWCRELQFPTVRELATHLGRSSPSTVAFGFGGLLDVHAAVIALEWRRLEHSWCTPLAGDRVDRLVGHAEELLAIDRACLRLPALVWSAVVAVDPSSGRHRWDLVPAVHALAAFVDLPSMPPTRHALRRALVAAVTVWHGEALSVPA